MTEVRTVVVQPQVKVVSSGQGEKASKLFLLKGQESDSVSFGTQEKKKPSLLGTLATMTIAGVLSKPAVDSLVKLVGKKFGLTEKLQETVKSEQLYSAYKNAWKNGKKGKILNIVAKKIGKAFSSLPALKKVALIAAPLVSLGAVIRYAASKRD